jgi:hypothetical protein
MGLYEQVEGTTTFKLLSQTANFVYNGNKPGNYTVTHDLSPVVKIPDMAFLYMAITSDKGYGTPTTNTTYDSFVADFKYSSKRKMPPTADYTYEQSTYTPNMTINYFTPGKTCKKGTTLLSTNAYENPLLEGALNPGYLLLYPVTVTAAAAGGSVLAVLANLTANFECYPVPPFSTAHDHHATVCP